MSILEEVRRLQQQGMSEDQIVTALQTKGVPYREISEALAQSKIKSAIEEVPESIVESTESRTDPDLLENPPPSYEGLPGMQKSILQSTEDSQETTSLAGAYEPMTPTENYPEYSSYPAQRTGSETTYEYPSYEYQAAGVSPETIGEISEQIVSEKMMEIRKHLDKVTDFKTIIEAKTESIEERLKRIEKIIDILQSSILKKVGDYATNIDDIKRELIETQKSFTKLLPEIKREVHKKKHKIAHKDSHKRKHH